MFRFVWVPERYKGFSFVDSVIEHQLLTDEIHETLAEVKKLKEESRARLADFVTLKNQWANLSEEERTENLRAIIKYFENSEE